MIEWPWILLLALVLDALFGEPDAIYRRVPHPAVLMGRAVEALERRLNGGDDATRRRNGVLALLLLLLLVGGVAVGLHVLCAMLPLGWALEAALASTLIAQRALLEHVGAVAEGLRAGGLEGGRAAVRHVVGRDPESLDEPGVARAAIESCAENASDGVVAPVFWGLLLGLPGLALYKAINTADSMIGHRSERFAAFGWAAARLDDMVNWPAARLCGALICVAGGRSRWRQGWTAMTRDAPKHRSPNAGWPEAAMAGVLGLALAGPRRYAGETVADAWMGDGGRETAGAEDIEAAVTITKAVFVVLAALVMLLALTI